MRTEIDPAGPPILVTGGTGTLGQRLVPRLRAAGHPVRVLSRQSREAEPGVEFVTADLSSGDGVEAAVAGAAVILHCAGSAKGDDDKARHLVFISVVGADRVPVVSGIDRAMFGYFAAKHAAEQVVAGSGLPWTTLRATQFHDLMLATVRAVAKLPVVPVPAGFRFQPVDTDEVAARLVELALGAPAGLVPDLAGPRTYGMDELVRGYLDLSGSRRALVAVRTPGGAARAFREGANLATEGTVGRRTWEDFLAERLVTAA